MISSRYKAYPEYKDSEVEFLGEVPEKWKIAALRRYLLDHKQGYYTTEDYVDEGVKLLRITDLSGFGNIDISNCPRVPDYSSSLKNYELRNGDVVFARTGGAGSFGVVKNLEERVVFASYLIRFRFCGSFIDDNYLVHMLLDDSFQKAVKQNIHGGVNQNIHAEDIKKTYLALPPLNEQIKIANFLDHETAKIDRLIEKQQQLIELLKEKRQAVISHAVTKGLNPDAPMKDSGVEWLGEVPEHWKEMKLKRMFKQMKRQGYSELEVLSVYRDYGVIKKSSRDDNFNKTPDDLSVYQLVESGDLVINKMKAWQGSLGVSMFSGITSPDYIVYKSFHHENDRYIHYSLRARHMPDVYRMISNGIRPSQWRIEPEKFEHLFMFLPPKNEQQEIIKYLDVRISKIDALNEKSLAMIQTLKERRTALISAAVTGKIDVRNWQPATPNQNKREEVA